MNTLYLEPCAGLGNRMLALLSGYALAKKNDYHLTVIWKREAPCNCPIEKLFTLPDDVDVISIYEHNRFKYPVRNFCGRCKKKRLINKCVKFIECGEADQAFQKNGVEAVDRILQGNTYLKSCGIFYDRGNLRINEVIRPVEKIQIRLDKLRRNIPENHVVGVHIRRTDHTQAIQNSPIELFVKKMDELLDQCDGFYLATDDACVKSEMRWRYGSKIVTYDCNLKRDSVQGIIDAFIDLYMLGLCERMIGSYGSTFSKVAAMLNNIPIQIIGDHEQI